ncbi:MAG TPA: MarR family winged helix-turn-helix transcriptional regulator [Candidatus Limnocylindria bacterium]
MPRFGRVAWHAAQECGMTSPERGRLLWVIGDKSVRAGLVAQQLKLSAGAVTELVESLVRQGLVRRDTDPDDRRAVVLALTAEGRKICERYELAASSALAEVLGRLTPPQRRRLRTAFADLNAAFTANDPTPARVLRRPFIGASSPRRSVRRITHKETANAR